MYHPQLQSVELPRPLLQLLSPKKKKIFDFPRQAGCQQVGNRHQNFPIFDKSISYLSHLKMKPRIKETKIWTLEKGLLCADFFCLSLIDVLMLHGDILCISLKALMKMMKKVLNLIPTMCMFGPDHWVTVWISFWLEPRLKQMPQVAPPPPQPPSQCMATTNNNYRAMITIGILIQIRHCHHTPEWGITHHKQIPLNRQFNITWKKKINFFPMSYCLHDLFKTGWKLYLKKSCYTKFRFSPYVIFSMLGTLKEVAAHKKAIMVA